MTNRLRYWQRLFLTYILGGKSNLSFWHGVPTVNDLAKYDELDQYYMSFHRKAEYQGSYDKKGIPQLNYQGDIGIQYNPIAIAQWSLGNYNLWKKNNSQDCYKKFIKVRIGYIIILILIIKIYMFGSIILIGFIKKTSLTPGILD